MNEEVKETVKRSRNLKNLYLDPNNYRFVDNFDYTKVSEENILVERIQKRTRGFIEGSKRSNIKDLIASFKANGFIDVDVIQVRDLGNNNYLVLEGNRRVTTLKALQEDYESGKDIGNLNPEIFKKVPFEIHDNETKEKHLIIMGLKHINGNKKWSAINQAQLIHDYLNPYWETDRYYEKENQLCASLGISKAKLRTTQRAYHLILSYRNSDFGDQFESEDFSLFVEIIKRPAIKEWLEWNDTWYKSESKHNLDRIFSWISTVEEVNDDFIENDEDFEDEELREREPIITKAFEIRDLALFIDNNRALKEMESTGSVSRGLLVSGIIDQQMYENSLYDLKNSVNNLSKYKDMITPDDLEELNKIRNKFIDVIPKKSSLDMSGGNFSVCFEHGKIEHFSEVFIENYKVFKKFRIEKLNKVNIFAGFNNSGKSSLLEAVYYLTKQNDIVAFLETIKLRNKLKNLDPVWLNAIFTSDDIIDVEGKFNGVLTSVKFNKFEATGINKKDDYLASYNLKSVIENRILENTIHTFKFETLQRENERVEHLCNSIIKSPYFYNLKEVVETYSKSTIQKVSDGKTAIKLVIEFLKQIDESIQDIRLYDIEEIERFIIDSTKFSNKNLEITNYGEGIQRIFEIALSFAYSRNGVVCIDEFETAIHYSLLVKFTKFVQILADIFNVQVFLTSHSKECIDAFVNNNHKNDEISAYFLMNQDNEVEAINVSGEKLKNYIESTNFDLRGKND